MSFGRFYASAFLIVFTALVGGGPSLHGQSSSPPAQSANGGVGLIVPLTGVADAGGLFSGALLIQNFAAQGNGVVATGVVTGALTGNGTFRNLVIQVMLPLDITASRARLNTDASLAQSSCDVLHVELGGTSVNILGSTVGLNPVAFDIASAPQGPGASSPVEQPAPAAPSPAQPGTVTPSPSANTTQPPINQQAQPSAPAASTPTPGAPAPSAPTQKAPTPAASQSVLASRLCSVNGFRNSRDSAQLAQQLNGILAALAGKQGS